MKRRSILAMASGAPALAFSGIAAAAEATSAGSRDKALVMEIINGWYDALRDRDATRLAGLLAPMAIVDKDLWRCGNPLSRACDLTFAPDLLAFASLRFATEVRDIEVDARLAHVSVLLRAWFPSQQGDYQRTAIDDFYLRKWPEKGWLVAVAGERTTAVP